MKAIINILNQLQNILADNKSSSCEICYRALMIRHESLKVLYLTLALFIGNMAQSQDLKKVKQLTNFYTTVTHLFHVDILEFTKQLKL